MKNFSQIHTDIRNILLLQQSFNCRKIIIINFFEIYLIMFFYNVIINKLSVTSQLYKHLKRDKRDKT